jgi:FdhD protein
MKPFDRRQTLLRDKAAEQPVESALISEEPLSIRIDGTPYVVIMRTPGDEIAHAAGFCLAEGIVDRPADIGTIGFCSEEDTNTVTVTLAAERRGIVTKTLERRSFISQTSCGICGKEVVKDLQQSIPALPDGPALLSSAAPAVIDELSRSQILRQTTRASHAAGLFTAKGELLSVAEDVGRHNALDKAVGRLFLKNKLTQAQILALSSRISYELVQKAARARIPIVVAVSRPTTLAVDLAERLNMTLACLAPGGGIFIYCGDARLPAA